jgi:hypothetical protein
MNMNTDNILQRLPCVVFVANEKGEKICRIDLLRLPSGHIRVCRPEPVDDASTCHDDPGYPHRMPFFEAGICIMRELRRNLVFHRLVVDKMWGWGTERTLLQDMYEANGFEPIEEQDDPRLNKLIREVNERLRMGLDGYTIEVLTGARSVDVV